MPISDELYKIDLSYFGKGNKAEKETIWRKLFSSASQVKEVEARRNLEEANTEGTEGFLFLQSSFFLLSNFRLGVGQKDSRSRSGRFEAITVPFVKVGQLYNM